MITIKHKDETDGSIVLMTNDTVYLDGKLEFFKRFLAVIGHPFMDESDLVVLGKDEMIWTDDEIETLKIETVENYLEAIKEDINNELPNNVVNTPNNYMDEAPF